MDHEVIWIGFVPSLVVAGIDAIVRPNRYIGFALIGISVVWTAGVFVYETAVLKIDDLLVSGALNLQITNRRKKDGLFNNELILHSVRRWDGGRKQFMDAGMNFPSSTLFGDKCHLPYGEPRTFQLVECSDRIAPPIIRMKFGTEVREWPLPSHGIYRLQMEIRWSGGSKKLTRFFGWSDNSLPTFRKEPR